MLLRHVTDIPLALSTAPRNFNFNVYQIQAKGPDGDSDKHCNVVRHISLPDSEHKHNRLVGTTNL
jgi:hypothetical protein